MASITRRMVGALRDSHERLFEVVDVLSPEDLTRGSYCDDWSIAQVLSHLGSAAEIGRAALLAATGGGEPLSQAGNQVVWDRWNAKSPSDQARDAKVADDALVENLEALDESELAELRIPIAAGVEFDSLDWLGLRLAEHALHSWDIVVILDPAARVPPDAVDLIIDRLAVVMPRFAKVDQWDGPPAVSVHTTEPTKDFVLALGERATLEAGDSAGSSPAASLSLPAEAWVRLVYGRLDDDHLAAGVTTDGVELDQLRRLFPGP